jgi:hypothetical protein
MMNSVVLISGDWFIGSGPSEGLDFRGAGLPRINITGFEAWIYFYMLLGNRVFKFLLLCMAILLIKNASKGTA